MLERFSREQLAILQQMLFDNAEKGGIPVSPIWHPGKCEPCQNCGDYCPKEFIAATPCPLCGVAVFFSLEGVGQCKNPECEMVATFYGLTVKINGIVTNLVRSNKGKYKTRRHETAFFFKKDGKQNWHDLSFDELRLGVLLEIKNDIKQTVTQLKGVVKNGAA